MFKWLFHILIFATNFRVTPITKIQNFLHLSKKNGIFTYLSFYLFLLARSHAIITPGSANLEFWRKKTKKNKKNLSAVF